MAILLTNERLDQYSNSFIKPIVLEIGSGFAVSLPLRTHGVPLVAIGVDGAGGAYDISFEVGVGPNLILTDLRDNAGSVITFSVSANPQAIQLDPTFLQGWTHMRLKTSIALPAAVNFELHFLSR